MVALGDAIDLLADSKVDLLHLAREDEPPPPAPKEDKKNPRVPPTEIAGDAQYRDAVSATPDGLAGAPGAILRARVQPDHWLTAGVSETLNVMVTGHAIYSPLKADKGVNAAYFQPADTVLASGLLWNDVRRQIAYKPLVVTENSGRGVVIGCTTHQLPRHE